MTFTPFSLPTEPNSQILLDSTLSTQVQGASTPEAVIDPQIRHGWYYDSALLIDNFIWTIFNGAGQNYTLGDVQNLTFTATHDNLPPNKCYIAISSATSKIVYENNNVDLIPGEKCLFYTSTIPSNPEQLRLVKLNLVTNIGPCLPGESLLSITLEGTNATSFPDVLQICVENIGYLFSGETVPVVINLSAFNPDVATLNATLQITNGDLTTLNGTLGTNTTALGTNNTTLGTNNTNLGTLNTTLGTNNTNLGTLNTTLGTNNTNLGTLNTTLGLTNTALGNNTTALGTNSGALGTSSTALGTLNTTLGLTNTALGTNTTALGLNTTALGLNTTALGTNSGSLGTNTTALGTLNTTLQSGVVTTSLPALNYDAFGRLRVSNPVTLFDSSNRYGDNGQWATSSTGGATYNFNQNQGLMDLAVTGTENSEVVRETYKVFPYQPGKSLLVMNTFVGQVVPGLRQRIGYFGTQNGIYFQINANGTCSIFKRSIVNSTNITTPVVTDTDVLQGAWNGDNLNGTGPSGITIDLNDAQILWMDFEWLGVGSVRVGFVIGGRFILCHTFNHANIIQSTYITTASLPLRYEITNTSGAGGTLKQICSTVISEGGYLLNGSQWSIATPIGTAAATTNSRRPVISVRLASNRLDAIVILSAMNLVPNPAATDTYYWEIVSKGVTDDIDAGWTGPMANSSVQYKIYGATGGTITMTNATVIASGFVASTNQSRGEIMLPKDSLFTFQLQRNSFTSTAYEMTLCCSSAGSHSVYASIDWEEVSR